MAKSRFKPEVISTTVADVEKGIVLCRENALRFVRNARLLLEGNGSDGLAYVLWSLGIEEFGKGVLLRAQIPVAGSTDQACVVELSKDHHEKFEAGLTQLGALKDTKFERLLRVRENIHEASVTIEDPLRPGAGVSVLPASTGIFSDGLDEGARVDPTVDLRFHLLYVAWQKETMRFVRPGETIRQPGLTARWELNRSDLELAIRVLEAALADTTT